MVLLLTGHDADFYWTPGGGIEGEETPIEAVRREVQEELNVSIVTLSHYLSYEFEDQKVSNYLAEISGDLAVGSKVTNFIWYSKGDDIKLSKGLETILLPKLLSDG
jgi:8-oxo-dGTP pyrophosphatase MutT (NUDIX family)